MKLIAEDDERLKIASELFDYNNNIDLKELTADMLEFMTTRKGLGLSAVQLGLPYNLFVIGFEPYLVINPDIIETGLTEYKAMEGCLSFPGLFLPVKRKNEIVLTYQDIEGKICTNRFEGTMARVIQHEIDHLRGITFRERVSKLVLAMADKKRKKRENRRSI